MVCKDLAFWWEYDICMLHLYVCTCRCLHIQLLRIPQTNLQQVLHLSIVAVACTQTSLVEQWRFETFCSGGVLSGSESTFHSERVDSERKKWLWAGENTSSGKKSSKPPLSSLGTGCAATGHIRLISANSSRYTITIPYLHMYYLPMLHE
jgi:hypothetical protein